jgi:predicted alpha/beta hydrolase
MNEIAPSPVQVPAADGRLLAGDLFTPAGPARAAVVIGTAMGVPRRIYFALARFFAEGGLSVLTFDYRGVGGSRHGPLRGFQTSIEEWAEQDLNGALRWAAGQHPGLPVLLLGHSLGGQILGLTPARDLVRAALFVASQSGYWGHWTGLSRLRMFLLWYALMPGLNALLGYLPMRRFTGGEDLPSGVVRQWARWGRHPRYILGSEVAQRDEGHARFDRPILSYALSDDSYAPVRAVEALLELYGSAPRELRVLSPRQAGVPRIGHFGWLKPPLKDALWEPARRWLLDRAC